MTSRTNLKSKKGFSLIELLMSIALIAILSVVILDVTSDSMNEARFEETVQKLNQIRNAMIGNPELKEGNVRTSFGFLGDIGAIPTAAQGIASLVAQPAPALPVYAVSNTSRFGIGWNGPYLSGGSSGTNFTTDAWGTTIVYSPAASPPTLVSYGADAAAGGTGFSQDITLQMPTELRIATVTGFICDGGGPFDSDAQVELNYPNGSGVLTQSLVTLTTGDLGRFSYASIPMGVRSITVYIPSKAAATTTVGPIVITIDKPIYAVPCNRIDINP